VQVRAFPVTDGRRLNPNLDARLAVGGSVYIAADVAGRDGTATVTLCADDRAFRSGRLVLEWVREASHALPHRKAVQRLVRCVALFRDVTLRSPDFHRAMNALFESGDDGLIDRINAPAYADRRRGRSVEPPQLLIKEIDARLAAGLSVASAAAELHKDLPEFKTKTPESIRNDYSRYKPEYDAWVRRVVPAVDLMDREWRHPDRRYSATSEEAWIREALERAPTLSPERKRYIHELFAGRGPLTDEERNALFSLILLPEP